MTQGIIVAFKLNFHYLKRDLVIIYSKMGIRGLNITIQKIIKISKDSPPYFLDKMVYKFGASISCISVVCCITIIFLIIISLWFFGLVIVIYFKYRVLYISERFRSSQKSSATIDCFIIFFVHILNIMDSLWLKDISLFQNFSFEVAKTFFESKGWTQRNSDRGYLFFADGYLHEVYAHKLERTIRAKCYRSQKKSEKPHSLHLTFVPSMEAISEAHCTCEAGNSESCNHLVALAYYLQHLILSGFNIIPEDASPTSLPMKWNKPRGKKINAEPLSTSVFFNPLKKHRTKDPVASKIRNPMANQEVTQLNLESLAHLKSELQKYEKEDIPFASTLTLPKIDETNYVLLKDDVYVPASSVLGHQARANIHVLPTVLPESEELPISLPLENKKMVDILISRPPVHHNSLKELSFEEAAEIEKLTRRQTEVDLWWTMRKLRFTASKFSFICKRRLFNDEFFKQFINKEDSLGDVKAIAHGRKYEAVAVEHFLNKNAHLKFFKCGLVVHPYALHLGASPDGILFDSSANSYGVLEIKCPYSGKAQNMGEYLKLKTFCMAKDENDVLHLKRNHAYYYQVQGQMLLTGLEWTDFVVFVAKTKEVVSERIVFDPSFMLEVYDKLSSIYETYFTNITF